jgi:hypothetical protein
VKVWVAVRVIVGVLVGVEVLVAVDVAVGGGKLFGEAERFKLQEASLNWIVKPKLLLERLSGKFVKLPPNPPSQSI